MSDARAVSFLIVLCGFLVPLLAATPAGAQPSPAIDALEPLVVRVDPAAEPGGDGLSWATAYDSIQQAIWHPNPERRGLHVWLTGETKEAVIYGDFIDPERVRFIGGFRGVEHSLAERDPSAPPFVWRGDRYIFGEACFFDWGYDSAERVGFERIRFVDSETALQFWSIWNVDLQVERCEFEDFRTAISFYVYPFNYDARLDVSECRFVDVERAIRSGAIEAGMSIAVADSTFEHIEVGVSVYTEAFNTPGLSDVELSRNQFRDVDLGVRLTGLNAAETTSPFYSASATIESSLFVGTGEPIRAGYYSLYPERVLEGVIDTLDLRVVNNTFVRSEGPALSAFATWNGEISELPGDAVGRVPRPLTIEAWNNVFAHVDAPAIFAEQGDAPGAGSLYAWRLTSNAFFDVDTLFSRENGADYETIAELELLPFAGRNLAVDPLFVAPDLDDFHLRPRSPLVDAGHPFAPFSDLTDLDGNPRAADGDGDTLALPDVGAYERPADAGP